MSDKSKFSATFNLSEEDRRKLEALAAKEERTLSGQCSYLFKKYIALELDNLLGTPSPAQ